MLYYLDSSIGVRAILENPDRMHVLAWLDEAPEKSIVSSRLLKIELIRVLRRESRSISEAEAVIRRVRLVGLSDKVASLAESIVPHVKSLDAIHLATALEIGDPITVVTHDSNMKKVAEFLGFPTFDPCLGK